MLRRTVLLGVCWSLVYDPLTVQADARGITSRDVKHAQLSGDAPAIEQSGALTRRAEQLWKKGDHVQAETLWRRALVIQEQTLGSEHLDVATTLYNLARLHQERGDYAHAETLWRRTLQIQEQTLGPEHPHVASTLHSLAGVYLAKGEYAHVEPLLQQALRIEEKTLGAEHPNVATTLHSLAYLSQVKGEYDRAVTLFARALVIEEQTLGTEHPTVAVTLHSLASVYLAKGAYDQAELRFQRALAIQEKTEGSDHPHTAMILDSLAGLYVIKGNYDRAEPLFQRALTIWKKVLGVEHSNVATTLNNLAELFREKKAYDRAEPLFQQALTMWEKVLGPEHPNVATVLHNLATLYREQGRYEQAEPLFRRALTMWEKVLGPEHPNVATVLHNLATLYRETEVYDRSEPLFQRALTIREKVMGLGHPVVAATLHGLAVLSAAQGEEAQAIAFQARCNEMRERNLALVLAVGSEEEKRAYLAIFSDETNVTLSLHLRFAPHDPQAARLALTTILRRKGRVLDALTDSLATLRRHLSSEDQAVLGQLAAVRAQLATWVLKGPGSTDPQQHRAQIAQFEAHAQQLEAQISGRSAAFRAQSYPVTIADVQQQIPSGAALVEFVLYRPFHLAVQSQADRWGAAHYAAYVLHHEGDLAWVDLGEAAPIDQAVTQVRRALSDPDYQDVQTLARALDEQVMRPVRPLLGNARLVLLSPDGQLNLLPFGVLVDEEHHYLIERLTLPTLTTGRDLLRLAAKSPARQGPLIVADPDFNSPSNLAVVSLTSAELRAGANRSGDWSSLQFAPLEGTIGEATVLKRLLPGATVLTEAAATEAALKQLQGPCILHVATHGFFMANHGEGVLEKLGFAELNPTGGPRRTVPLRLENPLLYSGLALAGANQPGGEEEDGVLTALEAAGLDLWGTKLVVLSACETGVGDVQDGEGVYGLRRAIGMAGAESQVMSLWKVGDKATRDLMVAYYARLILGEGRAEGLRNVQLQMLHSTHRSHPFYWASFIHSGDWTPIEELQPDLSVQGIMRALSAQFYRYCPSFFCW